jgi:hypothetical protein
MNNRQESALIALACLFVIFAFSAFLMFLAYSTTVAHQAVVDQVYSGWAGGAAQSVATLTAGILAIGAGALAYRGAIRAAQINFQAAERHLEATREKERFAVSLRAQALAVTHYVPLYQWMERLYLAKDLADVADEKRSVAEMRKWDADLPPFLKLPVEIVEVFGVDVIASREKLRWDHSRLVTAYGELEMAIHSGEIPERGSSHLHAWNRLSDEVRALVWTVVHSCTDLLKRLDHLRLEGAQSKAAPGSLRAPTPG